MDTKLYSLFTEYFGFEPDSCERLSGAGSNRQYYRLEGNGVSAIGVSGTDIHENEAFIGIGRHFKSRNLNVPEIYSVSRDGMCYIQEDLGDVSLYDAVSSGRAAASSSMLGGEDVAAAYSAEERALLLRTVSVLPEIQIKGAEGLDFGCCYPVKEFDARSVMFDLNYFKYCFLKTSGVEFDEMKLEDDFESLRDRLLSVEGYGFMYRDFQARNVMLRDGEPFFIDFQGGRKGPVHYDLASFVWQAKACYPADLKEEMLSEYLRALREFREFMDVDERKFREDLRYFVLFRMMQVLGAYGFRGRFEKKRHFIESIPYAMANLEDFLRTPVPECPYLTEVLGRLLSGYEEERRLGQNAMDGRLIVSVTSFSYRKGIPEDPGGNGGGYVFDCRSIDNPGKYEEYKSSTGMDGNVVEFLENRSNVKDFLDSVYRLVDSHAEKFLSRGFTHLSVCFGCTGGQHRSVYCAEKMAGHLVSRFGDRLSVDLWHREQGIRKRF